MQRRGRAEKRELEIDGVRYPGLNRCSALTAENSVLDVGELGRIYPVSDGQIKYSPIEGAYLDQADSGINQLLKDWVLNRESKQVTYIRIDGHGDEIQRILLPDCENTLHKNTDTDHNSVSIALIEFRLTFYEPVYL